MTKQIILPILLLLAGAAACAASSGEGVSGAQFLRIGPAARPSALGEAGAAAAGAQALFYNPAGLAASAGTEVFLSQTQWLQDVNYSSLALSRKVSGGALGFSANYLSVPATDKYDNLGNNLGDQYSASDLAAGFGFAAELDEKTAFGFAAKFVSSRLEDSRASGAAFDAGARYAALPGRLSLGAAVQNAGGGLKYESESAPLPLTFRAGGEYVFQLQEAEGRRQSVAALLDGTYLKDSGAGTGAGLEYASESESGSFALRGGWHTTGAGKGAGLTLGLGISSQAYMLDYSYSAMGDLGQAHRLSLTLRFGAAS